MPTVDFRLYLVTDRMQTRMRPLVPLLHDAGLAGLPAIQVRERDLSGRALLDLVTEIQQGMLPPRPRVLVNDRVDIALAAGADGVHLRSDSLPVAVARRLLGVERLLGVSTHCVEDVRHAEEDGADFAVLGPVYDTPSKREYGVPLGLSMLERAAMASRLPIFAIGGVTQARVAEVRRAGAFGVAVISALLSAHNIVQETQGFLRVLNDGM